MENIQSENNILIPIKFSKWCEERMSQAEGKYWKKHKEIVLERTIIISLFGNEEDEKKGVEKIEEILVERMLDGGLIYDNESKWKVKIGKNTEYLCIAFLCPLVEELGKVKQMLLNEANKDGSPFNRAKYMYMFSIQGMGNIGTIVVDGVADKSAYKAFPYTKPVKK